MVTASNNSMVANCGGRDKVIVIINQNGEDPPIVKQDKHGGHGERGPAFSRGAVHTGRRKRVVLDQTESELRLNSIFGHRKLSISFLLRLPPHRTA